MNVLALDIGGTKIAAGIVDQSGRFLKQTKIPTPAASWKDAKTEIVKLCKDLLAEFPDVKACGISSAGPLHAPSGRILNPTNMSWGEVDITKELEAELKISVLLENDAAAAVIGEHWLGQFKGSPSLVMLTLGTGLGFGVMLEHQSLRGGRGLHPEGGHLILDINDPTAVCGCGAYGCAEAYLAGSHFLKRARQAFAQPEMKIEEFLEQAEHKHPQAIELFENYSLRLAQMVHNCMILFYPYQVILGGSFAKASRFFLPRTYEHLDRMMIKRPTEWRPEIAVTQLSNAGILGAAKLALKLHDPNFR